MIDYPLRGHGRWGSTPQDHQRDRPRGNWESDNALDIAVPRGTPVYAVADGTLGRQFGPLNSSDPQLLGLRLHLTTSDNEYYYAHLSEFAPGIQPGVTVHRGDLLGYSGEAAGVAHLHFAVRHGDPTIILRNAREHTGPETRQGFQPTEGKSSNNPDGRTLDQILGSPDPPMTPQEINDLLHAAPGERSDAEVQAEKQQGMDALMKEIGADEPKLSLPSPETLQGRLADGNLNYTPAVENTSNITNRGDTSDAKGYSGGSSDTVGYDGGYFDTNGYDGGHPDAGGYDAGRPDASGASDGGADEAP